VPPTFSQSSLLGYVYMQSAKVGEIITTVIAKSPYGAKIQYICVDCGKNLPHEVLLAFTLLTRKENHAKLLFIIGLKI
jgi:hypothetical protein